MIDDAQLIEQTLSGDSASFGELVLRYQNRLYNTLAHFVGCREEAEDVVQDAFVQAFVKLESFQGTSAFYTWLYRIAFNVAISRQRRKRPATSIEQTRDRTGGEPVDPGDQPEQQLDRKNQILTRSRILTAFLLPECENQSTISPSISPVNTFRFIFREYLGAELDLLPDLSYYWEQADKLGRPAPKNERYVDVSSLIAD